MSDIKPINGNVFIIRDAIEKTHLGLHVSEKALTKNMNGVITHIESDKFVTLGSRVHIPHYNVKDVVVDGIEYVIAKEGDLFAELKGDTYQPINGYVKVRKCENDHIRGEDDKIVLHMTDNYIETTNWVEIIGVADDCKYVTSDDIGMFCVAPESSENLARLLYSKEYMLKENQIKYTVNGDNMIKPIGNCVILELYNNGENEYGIKTNSNVYTVISIGSGIKLKNGNVISSDLAVNSKVIVKDTDMIKMGHDSHNYFITDDDNIFIELTK